MIRRMLKIDIATTQLRPTMIASDPRRVALWGVLLSAALNATGQLLFKAARSAQPNFANAGCREKGDVFSHFRKHASGYRQPTAESGDSIPLAVPRRPRISEAKRLGQRRADLRAASAHCAQRADRA